MRSLRRVRGHHRHPGLRLKGHYFGIATLGIALAVSDIVANLDALGGDERLGDSAGDDAHFSVYYYAMWLVALAAILGTYAIARSKLGYAFVAIRENEDAAAVLGIWATRYKVTAWAISAMMAGAAGAIFAPANGFIDPSITFAMDANVFPIAMTILGGIGTVAGPFIGALILAGANELLQRYFVSAHAVLRRDDRRHRSGAAARLGVAVRTARRRAHLGARACTAFKA